MSVPILTPVQKYFIQSKHLVNVAYQFKGKIDFKVFEQAVNFIYLHNHIYMYNFYECKDNDHFVKNSEQFQKELDSIKKSELIETKNLEKELYELHNSSFDKSLGYGENRFLPIKFLVITGYKDNEFCIFSKFSHLFYDGGEGISEINNVFDIYTKIQNKTSLQENQKILENKEIITDYQMYKRFYSDKLSFWQQFKNMIKIMRPTLGDPGKLQRDRKISDHIFFTKYNQQFVKGSSNRNFQLYDNYDFSKIVKGVKKSQPTVSKNSIIQAFLLHFFDFYNTTVRSKQLGVDPEKVRGVMSFPQAYTNLDLKASQQLQGPNSSQCNHAYDIRKFPDMESLALQVNKDTKENRKEYISVTSQLVLSPLSDKEWCMKKIMALADPKHTYQCSNCTNIVLNKNPKLLKGGEFFRQSITLVYRPSTDEPPYPNFLCNMNMIINNLTQHDELSLTLASMNEEQNVEIMKQMKIFHKQMHEKYDKIVSQNN